METYLKKVKILWCSFEKIVVIVHAGCGGDDAKLFVNDLGLMYLKYALKKGFKTELLDSVPGKFTVEISGLDVYNSFRKESGRHCIQRVPPTERNGRMQTSMVSVAILPLFKPSYVALKRSDINVETKMGSGPGGQHRNSTESAVKMTHRPTGLTANVNSGRGQHQNRATALEVLTARVNEFYQEQRQSKYDSNRKNQLGNGGRGEKIRTYNFNRNEVVNHLTNTTIKDLKKIMKGNLELIQ